MKQFKKILIGVDLSSGDRAVAEELSAPNDEAVRQALWLAKQNSAAVLFCFAIELSDKARQMIAESDASDPNVIKQAESRLGELVAKAKADGIAAEAKVFVGKCSVEIVREVLRNQHDLVVVGTRDVGTLEGLLLGSSTNKILRSCPCAVWVTHPRASETCKSILVAHDMRAVGDAALKIGGALAELQSAQLHVLHAADSEDSAYPSSGSETASDTEQDRQQAFVAHVQRQLRDVELVEAVESQFVLGSPVNAILNSIQQHDIDLLIMGTVGRSGIAGLITGNTAETLLPQIPCSLLAIKPRGFESPITLDD